MYDVQLKEPIPFPVKLVLVYEEVGSTQARNITSRELYVNSKRIKHIADEDKVPFDRFHVGLALVHRGEDGVDLRGPTYKLSNEFSEWTV